MRAARLNVNVGPFNGGELVDLDLAKAKGWVDGNLATEVELTFDPETKRLAKVEEVGSEPPAEEPAKADAPASESDSKP